MEHGEGVGAADELGIEVQVEVEAAVGFGVVEGAGHEEVSGVVIALGFDEAGVERGEFGVAGGKFGGEDLEFFATAAFDEGAADEVVDDLVAAAIADGAHEAGDPGAGEGLAEGDAATFEEVEDQLEMLKFLDGDGIKILDAGEEIAVFFEVEGGGGGLAFEVGVVNEDGGEVGEDFFEPAGRDFFAEQEHVLSDRFTEHPGAL